MTQSNILNSPQELPHEHKDIKRLVQRVKKNTFKQKMSGKKTRIKKSVAPASPHAKSSPIKVPIQDNVQEFAPLQKFSSQVRQMKITCQSFSYIKKPPPPHFEL